MTRTMTKPRPVSRLGGAVVAVLMLLATVAGCGFDAQTLQPYTPADGVEFSVGDPHDQVLKVRNLLIVAKDDGTGFLSGSMITTSGSDRLLSVEGEALGTDGSPSGSLQVGSFSPVEISANSLTVLTDRAAITISQANLKPGGNVELTLTFATAGDYTLKVPVISADDPVYATVSPSAAPSQP